MTTLTRWALPALAVAALLLLAWFRPGMQEGGPRTRPTADAAESPRMDLSVARRVLRFDLEHSTRTAGAIRVPDSPPQPLDGSVVVRAEWIVREYADGLIGWRLRDPQLDMSTPIPTKAAADLTREILLERHPSGALKRFFFPPDLAPIIEAFWQEWADAALVVRPEGPADRWTIRGKDSLGSFVADWERHGDEVTRVKTGYSDWRSEGRARYRLSRDVAEAGDGTIRLQGRAAWMDADITKSFRFLLRDESFARPELAAVSGWVERKPGEMPQIATPQDGSPRRSFEDLLAALQRLDLQGWDMPSAAGLFQDLVKWISSTDVAAERIRAHLLDPALSFRIKEVLLDALGGAGTPEARRVIAGLIAGPDRELGARALLATWNLREPGDAIVRSVGDAVRSGPPGTEYLRQALRAAGRMSLIEAVRARKSDLLDDNDRAAYLDALGSARSAKVFDEVRRTLSASDSDVVRVAAVGALAYTPHPDAGPALLRLVETETSSPILVEAIFALAERAESGPEVRSALTRRATDPRVEVRLAAVEYFERIGGEEAAALLREAERNDPEESVREFARSALLRISR